MSEPAGATPLRRVLTAQLTVTGVLALVLWLAGPQFLHSALVGAGISVAGNGYAAWRVFSGGDAKSGPVELFTLYRAEFGKLIIIGALCAGAFAAIDGLNVVAFVGGLVLGMITATLAAATQPVQVPESNKDSTASAEQYGQQ
ncbi:MAG: ATP synthase subunit I [Arenicellales bacterium]|nr:ATP synthase subunit I [Arenicellales bacterium]